MKKIKSTKSFKAAVDETFDVQELRDEKKRQYEDLRKDFDSRHEDLCEYASEHPEVFNGGDGGRTSEGTTERVRYRMTNGETLERIDGGSITDKNWLNTLPDEFVRQKPELNRLAIKGAQLDDDTLAELGLKRVSTKNMKLTAI